MTGAATKCRGKASDYLSLYVRPPLHWGGRTTFYTEVQLRYMERFLPDLDALTKEARTFVARLAPRERGATLITLSGELGAGKTSFAQGMAAALGVSGPVTSPTFVLEKVYQLHGTPFSRLIHIDAYRLTGGEELRALGFDEIMGDARNLVVLEWPEKVADLLPAPLHRITLLVPDSGGRSISYA